MNFVLDRGRSCLEARAGYALADQIYPTRWLKRLPLETTSEAKEPIFQVPGALAILGSAASLDGR